MKLFDVVLNILCTGFILKAFEEEIAKISKLIREKPFETFVIIGLILLLINSISGSVLEF